MYTVYKHTAPGGKVYIGITGRSTAQRWRNDGSGYKQNKHFYRAIQLYGWENIKHEVIKEGLTRAEAAALEVELIAKYDSTNPEKGYNSSTGGDLSAVGVKQSAEANQRRSEANKGRVKSAETCKRISEAKKGIPRPDMQRPLSEETRRKISEANRGKPSQLRGRQLPEETRQKISEANRGRKLNKAQRQRISEAHKGKPLSAEHRQKLSDHSAEKIAIICLTTGEAFRSITAAALAYGIDRSGISRACKGELKQTHGLSFAYIDDLQAPETRQDGRNGEAQANTPDTTKGA